MARPRKQTYTMSQYLNNVSEGYIKNDADTQRNPAWKAIIDGLSVTILTDDYIPSIILAEEDSGQTKIVDGGSRTAAFQMLRSGNYKIKSSVDDPIIEYKKMIKDSDGNISWEDAEFDVRNKTYNQFPKELQKKFDEYQVETVIHEHCNKKRTAKYMKRYNERKNFTASQKQFLYLPDFADQIRSIMKRNFFVNCCNVKEIDRENGVVERIISESVMIMFHFDKWNKNGKKLAIYLNDNATEEQFNTLDKNIIRLGKIVEKNTRELFTVKDSFIWITLFNKFLEKGLEDVKFNEFLTAFIDGLRNKSVDNKLFDTVDENASTKDKSVIADKLHILETLMDEFLHIDETETENEDISTNSGNDDLENPIKSRVLEDENDNETVLSFVQENADEKATDEDIELYTDMVDDYVKIDSEIYLKCKTALIALMAYACKKEKDQDFEEWFKKYQNQTKFSSSQKVNYTYFKRSFDKYISA